jgi:hypothetical protein
MSEQPNITSKPTKPKPQFYAVCFPKMQEIARDMGYNLVIHGSLNRDFDLIAIPWSFTPSSHIELITSLDEFLNGSIRYPDPEMFERGYMYSKLPGARSSYVINLYRGGYYYGRSDSGERLYDPDPEFYVDISVTPYYKDEAGPKSDTTLRTENSNKSAFEKAIAETAEQSQIEGIHGKQVNCLTRALWHWDKYGGTIMYDSFHATVINSSRFYRDGHKQDNPQNINVFGLVYLMSSHRDFLNEDEIKILERYMEENPIQTKID